MRHDRHPRWAENPSENEDEIVRPIGGHYKPGDYGASPTCVFCGVDILDNEDWEGKGREGAQHQSPPRGCIRAIAREVLILKARSQ